MLLLFEFRLVRKISQLCPLSMRADFNTGCDYIRKIFKTNLKTHISIHKNVNLVYYIYGSIPLVVFISYFFFVLIGFYSIGKSVNNKSTVTDRVTFGILGSFPFVLRRVTIEIFSSVRCSQLFVLYLNFCIKLLFCNRK